MSAQQSDTAARVKFLVQELNIMLRKAAVEGVTVKIELDEVLSDFTVRTVTGDVVLKSNCVGTDITQLRVKTMIDIGDKPE